MTIEITCMTATYGRSNAVRRALGCFMAQIGDFDALLIIHNNHPTPMRLWNDRTTASIGNRHVTVYNEPGYATLGDVRNRMISRVESPFARTWDDDDFYLPWSLADGVQTLHRNPQAKAYRPTHSWFWTPDKLELARNAFEAAITVRTDTAKQAGYAAGTGGDEHGPLLAALHAHRGLLHEESRGALTGYAYCWGWGGWHISGSLGADTVANRTAAWISKHNDVEHYASMSPLDVSDAYKDFAFRCSGPGGECLRTTIRAYLTRFGTKHASQ